MNTHTTELLVLQDGRGFFYVPLPLYRRFRDAILIFMPDMIPKIPHKAERLLGKEIWSALDAGGRRVAGRCVAHMVRQGEIRLRRVGCKHEHPARYELATSQKAPGGMDALSDHPAGLVLLKNRSIGNAN